MRQINDDHIYEEPIVKSNVFRRIFERDNALSRLERSTAVTTHPGYSVVSLALKRVRVLVECIARMSTTLRVRRVALATLKQLRETKPDRNALVLGNGPSVSTLDIEWLNQNRSSIDVFVVNWFPLSPVATEIVPDCVVLSDPHNFPGNSQDERNQILWEVLEGLQPTIFLPMDWYTQVRRSESISQSLQKKIYFFNDQGLEGWTTNISPLRPRGYLSLTAYKALAISIFLGYKRIFLLGIDNTMYQTVEVDQSNTIHLDGNHFYEDPAKASSGNFYPSGIADLFYDYSLCFLDLVRCFGKQSNVIHLDPNSKVDAFRKRSTSEYPELD